MPESLTDRTRDRLLRAAGEVFAERGFRRATVREICRRAHVNIASVNYYFKGKQELYDDVLEYSWRQVLRKYPDAQGTDPSPPEERLRRFVHTFLRRILDEGKPAWFGRLMAREIVEPTGALERLIERAIRPLHETLHGLVREILGRRASPETVRRHVFGILGQCLFYRHGRHVISRIYPEMRFDAEEVERIAGHIFSASLAALRGPGARR
ncbi:MAG: CerR family C-terminal domain-containing protein [Deltaproteobacteria bacterium]